MASRTEKINVCISKQQALVFARAAKQNMQTFPDFVRSACTEYTKKIFGAVKYKRIIYSYSDEAQHLKTLTDEELWDLREHERLEAMQPALDQDVPRTRATTPPLAASGAPTTAEPDNDIIPYEAPVTSPAAMQAQIRADALQKNQNDRPNPD